MTAHDRPPWWLLPVAIAYLFVYPLVRLWQLPNDLRLLRLEARLVRDFDAYHQVRRVRWFTRDVSSIASGVETDEYFELDLADGRTVVILDTYDRRTAAVLADRGLLPTAPISLGLTPLGFVWMFVLIAYAVLAFACGLAC